MDGSAVRNDFAGAQVVGTVVQAGSVQEIHQHFGGEAPVRIPRQLPAPPVGFVNRLLEQASMDELLASAADRCQLVVLSGIGGVGKTGLGLHWAHSVSDRFPGGQLYADLASVRYRGGVDVDDVLGGFLRALGVRDEWMPDGLAEKGALFRSLVADRRILVLLDNAGDPAQVRPLLPASPGSMVLVTSRHRLSGLLIDGATPLPLEPLDTGEGVRLLGQMLTSARVDAEAEAASELVRHCGGLPIALRVCGARLMGRRQRGISRLSADLADEHRRLAQLSAEGKPIVEAIFDAAYESLPAGAARLYRGLGAHPGPEFSLSVIAVIAEVEEEDGVELVDSLIEASLLEEVGDDRYRFHDLVHLHARTRAQDEHEVRRRIVVWYLDRARAADWAVLGRRLRLADLRADSSFPGAAEALGWLETEKANLVAAVRLAVEQGWDEPAWQLGEVLWAFYDNRTHHADELEVAALGVEAARRTGDPRAEAKMRNQYLRALLRAGETERALAEAETALELAARCGHRRIESAVIESSGFVHLATGDPDAAIAAFERSMRINEEAGNPRGVGLQNLHVGLALKAAGRQERAVEVLELAMGIMAGVQDELSQGKIGLELGESYLALERRSDARRALARALDVMTAYDLPMPQVRALRLLAEAAPDAESAERFRQAARALQAAGGAVEDTEE